MEEGETILSPGHHSFLSVLKSFGFVWKQVCSSMWTLRNRSSKSGTRVFHKPTELKNLPPEIQMGREESPLSRVLLVLSLLQLKPVGHGRRDAQPDILDLATESHTSSSLFPGPFSSRSLDPPCERL